MNETLVQTLQGYGFALSVARYMVANHPAEVIERQVWLSTWRPEEVSPGNLRRWIMADTPPPPQLAQWIDGMRERGYKEEAERRLNAMTPEEWERFAEQLDPFLPPPLRDRRNGPAYRGTLRGEALKFIRHELKEQGYESPALREILEKCQK